jgi:hypothetical protein
MSLQGDKKRGTQLDVYGTAAATVHHGLQVLLHSSAQVLQPITQSTERSVN